MLQRLSVGWRGVLLVAGGLAIAACDSELARVPDQTLQERVYECNHTFDQSPGFAIRCDNYRRECLRRRDEGRFVC
ncbi:MAG TPA: hypothetical protein VF210_11295 [Pseudomonadales bacterium]